MGRARQSQSQILSEKWGKVTPWLLMIFCACQARGERYPYPINLSIWTKLVLGWWTVPTVILTNIHVMRYSIWLSLKKKDANLPSSTLWCNFNQEAEDAKTQFDCFNQHHQYEKLLFDNFIRLLKLSPNCWSSVETLLDYFKFNQIADSQCKLY